ncbi:MAG: hypothetical protein IT289_07865 [Oligoflexia bacterium]|nr:hypothetical protein [Oligoflexia bacterium]
MRSYILSLFILLISVSSQAQQPGLVIHAAELGVAKFHRMDAKVHAHLPGHSWLPYVIPDGATNQTPQIYQNQNGSVTIVFAHLEELFRAMIQVSSERKLKVGVLNVHAHGMPGGMWHARDAQELQSMECASWRSTVYAPDKSSYDQYYTPISKGQILEMRRVSQRPAKYGCVAGLADWQLIANRNPMLKQILTDDVHVNFLSCVVGMGPVGEAFTRGIGQLLGGSQSMVKSSIKYGLGDWSMPEGMGFWDYVSDDQLARDNSVYPVNRKDREIAQKGPIRVAHRQGDQWIVSVVADQDFMLLNGTKPGFVSKPTRVFHNVREPINPFVELPVSVTLPGTTISVRRLTH